MPVDAKPDERGNLRIVKRQTLDNRVIAPLVLYLNQITTFPDWEKAVSAESYVSHFVTCPDRVSWRKRR